MRRLILLGLAAAMVLPAAAARRVSIGQLSQTLAADRAIRRGDAEVAHQIGSLELSERLSQSTLDRLGAEFKLGPKATLGLELLADQSAFLDPPKDELPGTASPDIPSQRKIIDAALRYAIEARSRLPNFFATLTTYRFDDSPQIETAGGWPVRDGLHPVASWTEEATFRDGQDVRTKIEAKGTAALPAVKAGLTSWGEFGPVVALIISDAAKGKLTWSHWEQAPSGLGAVFRYSVPKAASHYAVSYCCTSGASSLQSAPSGARSRIPPQMLSNPGATGHDATYHETPGYHGTISIDPASGAILRLTLEADLGVGDPLSRAAIAVEYGAVSIGDRTFVCPVRSLAISIAESGPDGRFSGDTTVGRTQAIDQAWDTRLGRSGQVSFLQLNETRFTNYHRLGTTMRLVSDASSAAGPGKASDAKSASAGIPEGGASPANPVPSPPIAAAPAQTGPLAETTSAPALSPESASPAPAADTTANPEISMSAASEIPDLPAGTAQPRDGLYSLKLTSRLVDMGIVAHDKKGRPVTGLKAEDIEIYDNGQKQEIRFFSQPNQATPPPAAETSAPINRSFTNRAIAGASMASAGKEEGATVLLIDESHIAWADLVSARRQMTQFLEAAAPGERIGLYTMSSLGFRVLTEITADHAAVTERLKTFMPTAQSLSQAQEEEIRNRQHIDEVRNVSDLNAVNGNQNDLPEGQQTVDPQLRAMGSNPIRASLIILTQVARHLSAVPGHKRLVWVSSDNVFADWQDQAVGIEKSPNAIDRFALRAQEAMNDAHAAVYPFDVSQLEPGATTADLQHMNVELSPAAKDTASLGGNLAPKNNTAGRIAAEMMQNIHPIQGDVREVADATGGRTIRRTADLGSALSGIVEDGRATYQVSFSPSGPADDQYHAIRVKLAGKRGVTLRYRTGYLFSKEPVTLKDRFQQAVWRPLDVAEIAVTAVVGQAGSGTPLKINVAAGDLGMQQQADRWMDKLDIFLIQRDDPGLHANIEGTTLGLRLTAATYQTVMTQGLPFETQVVMRPGMESLRVLVVDENSGRMGSVTIPSLGLKPVP